MRRSLRFLVAVPIALALGAFGIFVIFTDLGPTGTRTGRTASAVVLFLVSGLILGLLNPERRGWLVAGLAAWVPALLGGMGLWLTLTNPVSGDYWLALTYLLGPLALALTGGYLGARLRRRRDRSGRSALV